MNLKQKLTRLIKESLANKLSEYDTSGLHSPHIANDGQFDNDDYEYDEIGDDDSVNKSLNKDINVVQSVLGAIHNESVNEAKDIYDKFLDNPTKPKGRAKVIISKFINDYGVDATSMAVDRFAKSNNLKPEEKYILKYITRKEVTITSKPGGPDFSILVKESINEQLITEGVNDPNILKAVFLAGGPGSGKSFAITQVLGVPEDIMKGTSSLGLKVVNSDPAFEQELKKRGVDPKNLAHMTQKVFDYYTSEKSDSARGKAKKVKTKLERIYHEGRLGLIIDGTGHDYGKLAKKKQRLEQLGYDTSMIFVNKSLPVALSNNKTRDRVLPEKVVKTSWHDANRNMDKFKSLFGSNFTQLDNSERVNGKTDGEVTYNFGKFHADKLRAVMQFLKKPLKNSVGKQWIEDEKKLRSLGS